MIDPKLLWASLPSAFSKLDPRVQWRNPVMFVVEIGSALTTILFFRDPSAFSGLIIVWLWLTVLFANLAEAVAEGRGKAQAAALRAARQETMARRLRPTAPRSRCPGRNCGLAIVASSRWVRSSPVMARSSRASPAWMRVRSPASRLP